jgi:hypothetical protein
MVSWVSLFSLYFGANAMLAEDAAKMYEVLAKDLAEDNFRFIR